MKIAFSTLACPAWSTEEIIDNAVEMGFDGIEWRLIDGEVIDPVKDSDKLKEAVLLTRARELDVCALDTSCRLNQSDPVERARQIAELQSWIQLAGQVHVPILRVFGGESDNKSDRQASEQKENRYVVDALKQVVQQAEQANVTIALETHDAFSSARRVAQVLAEIDSPAIGALWDSHHPYRVGESAKEVLEVLGKRIVHVHVKDAFRIPDSDKWQLVLLGEGTVPVKEQLQYLHLQGYTGYVAVEWEKRWHLELANPEISLPEHLAWLKRFDAALAAK